MKTKTLKLKKNYFISNSKKLYLLLLFSSFTFAQTIALQSFGTGFSNPVAIVHADDSRLFVVEKGGLIKILNANGTVNTTPFLDISSLVSTNSERGLLGLDFHPNYTTNGYFFINYTDTSGDTVIARYKVLSSNPNVANNTSGVIILTIDQPYENHNGGSVKFGPDGYLYIGMGDGGSGGDPEGYAQNTTVDNGNPSRVFLGKMLRLNVSTLNSPPYYTIPSTNPFFGEAGKGEIWATGLRNPWKFSFNSLNGDLWIADVGQGNVEEINKIVAPIPTGLNFGWRCYEGNVAYNTAGCVPMSSITMPFAQYTHTGSLCSITGGYVYTGSLYPNFQDKYFFADYCVNRIGYVDTTGSITYTPNFSGNAYYTSFGEDNNGELYIAASSNGTIYKITDSSLSSENFEKNGFAIYPNPAKESFTISNSNNIVVKSISIYDVAGKKILTKDLSQTNTVDISGFSKGIYAVTILDANDVNYNTKLVVQ